MPANWLSNSSDVPRRITDTLEVALRTLSQPANARRLRQVLLLLFACWGIVALSQLIWALFPVPETPLPEGVAIINPVSRPPTARAAGSVDIKTMQGWHLFGEVGALPPPVEVEQRPPESAREGIEKGARKTRLDLKLRGIVASTVDGLGHAIIEYKSRQAVYAVDDKLPVSGAVVLAKVMPGQVVLDNDGTYELLELFSDSELDRQLGVPPGAARPAGNGAAAAPAPVQQPGAGTEALAQSYRDRLYQNPQSLVDVVTVSAVRENGELLGYRIAPGKEREQFEQLGFRPGDLVTSVNGIALNDPANTVRLYQAMRSAGEAVFDLERDRQQMTITVSLGGNPGEE